MKKTILTIASILIVVLTFAQTKPIPYQPNPNRIYEFTIKGTESELSIIGAAFTLVRTKIDSTDNTAKQRNIMKAYVDKTIQAINDQYKLQYDLDRKKFVTDSLKNTKH